ncbi:MAG: M28 family peptidase [Clostridia bacterium]|nr:M28 family peptidase [Clostridia bacterium]
MTTTDETGGTAGRGAGARRGDWRRELAELRAALDTDRLWRHVEAIGGYEKHAGTEGELASLRYVEGEMQAYGFQTELLLHDAYISLPGPARLEVEGETLRCITHSFSRPSGPSGVEAEVVYVGSGRPEDFARVDVSGRIALLDGIASPRAAKAASEAGALGQIHISPHEYLHEMCISPVWGSPDDRSRAALPRTVVVTVSLADGERLKERLGSGRLRARLFAQVDTGWRKTPILVADMLRPDAPGDDPFILFTGHHDSWYYGAMDNGGANATMLEVARLVATRAGSWRRSLRVVFWSGHSQGRYSSSTWYADHRFFELEGRALAHVNVDSTGGRGNTVVCDTTAAAELSPLAREALAEEAGQPFCGRRMERAGDQSFWGIGVPSMFGNLSAQPLGADANAMGAVLGGGAHSAGTGWWWHNPADTVDKLDPEILRRDTAVFLHAVWRLLAEPVVPLDFRPYADEARAFAEEQAQALEGRFDLSGLARAARELRRAAESFETAARDARAGADPERAPAADRALLRASRALVPVAYTTGDRFGHDPALAQPPFPALADLPRLVSLPPDCDEHKFLATRLRRAANRVEAAWREGASALAAFAAEAVPAEAERPGEAKGGSGS